METQTQTDEELATLARGGSLESFENLVRRYQVPLMRFLQRRAPGRRDHEDVIQEAFLRAFQSLERYREEQPFKPWLFTIAYRVSIDAGRRWWPLRLTREETEANDQQGPYAHVAGRDEKDHLWQLARRVLKDESFSTVWLFYGESVSTEQIAQITGRSRDWVKTTLVRARNKIKVELQRSKP